MFGFGVHNKHSWLTKLTWGQWVELASVRYSTVQFICWMSWVLVTIVCLLICSVVSGSLGHHGLYPSRLLCPWGFSRQEYWRGLPCPPPGDLPNPGIEPRSALKEDSLPSEPPREAYEYKSGQPIPSPGDLPDPGIKLGSPALQVDYLPAEIPGKPLG